jgi:hypothetical protein
MARGVQEVSACLLHYLLLAAVELFARELLSSFTIKIKANKAEQNSTGEYSYNVCGGLVFLSKYKPFLYVTCVRLALFCRVEILLPVRGGKYNGLRIETYELNPQFAFRVHKTCITEY